MSNPSLCKSIEILCDMEINNYLMSNMEIKLNEEIERLAVPRQIEKPAFPPPNDCSLSEDTWLAVIPLSALGFCLGGFLSWFLDEKLFENFKLDTFWYLCFAVLGLLLLGGLGVLILWGITKIAENNDYSRRSSIYSNDMRWYNKEQEAEKARMQREKSQKAVLIAQRNVLKEKQKKSLEVLARFYQSTGIDSRFQNLICIGYMNEFARLGIATRLEGSDGLYYLILKELRYESMNARLDEIISKLSELVDSQRDIYRSIIKANETCAQILQATVKNICSIADIQNKTLQEISKNTQLTAYTNERVLAELNYQTHFIPKN